MPFKGDRNAREREHYSKISTVAWRQARAAIARHKYATMRRTFIESRGGKCEMCGFEDYRALQIDHINGNGTADRKRRGPAIVFVDIWRHDATERYQILCANCNQIKRHEKNEYSVGALASAPPKLAVA